MNKDMHSSISVLKAIDPQAVGTTGAAGGKTSGVIDRRGYRSVAFAFARGVSAAATDTITPVILEADATDGSFTSAADADLNGTEAGAVMLGSGGAASRIGVRSSKRYLKCKLYGVGTATAIVSAVAVLGNPDIGPVAQ